jgi:hypothetical protein
MRCDRCSAEDKKPHPAGGFIVKLEEVKVMDLDKTLCQRCKVRELVHADENEESSSFRLSIKKLISKFF